MDRTSGPALGVCWALGVVGLLFARCRLCKTLLVFSGSCRGIGIPQGFPRRLLLGLLRKFLGFVGIPQGFPRRFAFVLRTPRNSFLLGVPPVASATMDVDLMSRIKAKQVLLGIPQHCRLTSVSLCIFLVHSSLRFASLRSASLARRCTVTLTLTLSPMVGFMTQKYDLPIST